MPDQNPVAIIGIGCLFPGAIGLKKYWQLLFQAKDAITEIPASHWSASEYYDPDPKRPDHVYCTRGGFLEPVEFDPSEFGIPPNSLEATDTSQLLGLLAAKMALEDCGCGDGQDFDRDRTSVILGVTGTQELVIPLSSRLGHPKWRKALIDSAIPPDKTEEVIRKISDSYVPWQENSFPGLLGNVVAGRICNRLDLRGTNCVVDAACASSLSAVHLGLLELESGRSDMVVTGGVDTLNDIFMHMCFSKTGTLSASGDARPFSKNADGTVLGEGIGMLVLKRLADAESDGNRIYAVIKGLGSSSDGKSQSIYAPRSEGQARALRAAYKNAGISPAGVQLVEAHGTGTRVGDKVEFEALNQVFKEYDVNGSKCALGSVKSMIGHTKASAGAAGLIKAALGLYHKVLPPTLKAETPDPALDIENSHFYLNTTSRPWFSNNGDPRRAGVSAFGFGGSNFHVVLEEYDRQKTEISWNGSTEIIAFSAARPRALAENIRRFKQGIEKGLSEQEFSLKAADTRHRFSTDHPFRTLIVTERFGECEDLLQHALKTLDTGMRSERPDTDNIYAGGPQPPGKLAFVFPGQGSQYLGMGRDIVCTFPRAMEILNAANDRFRGNARLSDLIFPLPAQDLQMRREQESLLKRTDHAQPSIGAISLAMLNVLQDFGIEPDAVCGHSFGELTALCAAGWISEAALLELSNIRGELMAAAGGTQNPPRGAMLAVRAPLNEIEALLAASHRNVVLANRNSPTQGVLSGATTDILEFEQVCRNRKFGVVRLPVSAAFHSQQLTDAVNPFLDALQEVSIESSAIQVYANSTANPYPTDPERVRKLLSAQLIQPVDFANEIENLYSAGMRTFVEIGPKDVLTGLISANLQNRPFEAQALDASKGKANGVADLAHLLCRLAALGHSVKLTNWEKPLPLTRQSRMQVLLNGANYFKPKPEASVQRPDTGVYSEDRGRMTEDRGQKTEDRGRNSAGGSEFVSFHGATGTGLMPTIGLSGPKPIGYETMDKENSNQSEFLRDTYRVVAEGLKAMQRLQSQTAEAHHKFLETQSAANRALQEMVKSVQLLAGKAPAVTSDAGQSEDSLVNTPQSVPLIRAADPTRQVGERRYQSPPPVPAGAHKNQTRPPSPSDLNLQHAAANGYGTDHNLPEQDPEPKPTTSESTPGIESVMLEIVSRLTGYPIEMLGMDMDIEAELGIDSIKRVEILSTLEEQLPDLPPVSPDLMGSLKTLGQIVQYLSGGDPDRSQKNRSEQIVPAEIPTTATASVDSTANHARDLTTVILAVVSRLTGYPTEMLGMDMDIEAELGIDSIKRVEILSSLEEEMPGLPAVSPDVMGTLKTLGQVVAYFRTAEEKNSTTEAAEKAPSEAVSAIAADEMGTVAAAAATAGDPVIAPLARNIVTIADAPPVSGNTIAISGSKKVFVTEDNTGLSEEITEELSKMNVKTVKISPDILKYRKQLPPAAGLIIVQDPESGKMDQDLEEAFTLAQHLAPDLIASAHDRGAVFATITRLDGAFGLKRKNLKHPVQGGLAGLAKTAAIEWENVCCHAIDIAPEWTDNRAIASAVVKEVMSAGPIEIGLDLNSRCTLSLQNAPLPMGSIHLNENDVVIISGGARGVTAAAAVELARHTGCKMVLLGRSPQPAAEPGWLSALEDEAEIKKAILENEFHGQNASLADIEKSYRRYMANREIAINMRRLEAIGTQFNYYSADVRDYEATCAIINHIRENIGPISVIIHGAGVLEDRLITAKTVDQFRRVYDTKVKGLNNLLKATQNDSLKFLILFSSVAARTGNKGQVDYAMANEVLNKVAQVESSRRGDCRVKSINWGPWDGGMVTPALKRQFERSGINLIPIESGAQAMLGEMMDMRNGPVEVIIGGELPATAAIAQNRLKRPELVKSTPAVRKNQLALSFDRKIDIHQYPVLQSHVIDGKPVVPLALMTEWFAHGALHENPGLILHGLDDIRVMKGIRLEQNQAHIQLLAGKPRKNKGAYEVEIELRDGKSAGRNITHARATAILSGNRAPAPNYQLSTPMVAQAYTRTMTEVYDKILFHGPQLHGILKIVSCSARGMVAHISTAPPPQEWMTAPLRNQWIADPLAIDCAFQMATVWCFEEKGLVSLPSYAASYRQYSSCFPGDSVTVVLEIKATANRKMQGDFTFLDSNDRTIASLKGYEAIMDASLFKAFQPQYRASA